MLLRSRVCPPAPIKPHLRDTRDPRTLELAVQIARSTLQSTSTEDNSVCSLQALLQNLPRHLLLPVFNAYCEWAACLVKERGGAFQALIEAGPPKMDAHLLEVLGLPEEEAASVQAWERLALMTANDPELKQALAEHFQNPHSSAPGVARKLNF
mmetsp:Transcript_14430/g.39095  ORF Transcript_14430/g.39095 Transcript_14430/m.39095 type:complete len:154 (-) Transcript_14430:1167-1628(-)